MGRGRREIGTAITAGCQHRHLGAEQVQGAVVQLPAKHPLTGAVLRHDQVDREIFDEKLGLLLQALTVERVQDRVAGTVGGGAGALHLGAFAHVLHVPAERALVDRAVVVAAERNARVLQLVNRCGRLAHHVFDRVLVAQPVRPLDGIVHVPRPVIGRIVAQRCGDAALCGDRVAARGKDLGDIGGAETGLGSAHRGAQARSARAHDHHVIHVVDDVVGGLGIGVGGHQAAPPSARRAMANRPNAAPANAKRLRARIAANLLPAS